VVDFNRFQMTRSNLVNSIAGPVLALDLGQKLVGVALSDEILLTARRLDPLRRSNWKQLLRDVLALIRRYDARTLVIGLPLSLDGTTGSAAEEVQRISQNFARSLEIPVFLQDERLTSFAARQSLMAEGVSAEEIPALIDGEAAATILRDFLANLDGRVPVFP
jgi:putative Holliday junction resolvase